MRRWGAGQLLLTVLGSVLLWAALASAGLLVGSTGEIGWPDRPAVRAIRFQYVVVASIVGAALAAAGVAYQAILRNPLADPYLLGISSGASLFSFLWTLPAAGALLAWAGSRGQVLGQQAFAFAGAVGAMALVFALASRRGRLEPITLLLVGVIVNAVNASVFLLLNAVVKDTALSGGPMAHLVGSLQTHLTAAQKWTAGAVIAAGWLVLLYVSGQLNVAGLSEAEATALGVRLHRLRWAGLLVASLMTASAVAVSGPIGFVGLVCPHLGRLIVGPDQRRLLPVATALGAGLLCVADAASRWLAQSRVETVLPVGVLTGLMGGPFFLLLLWQNRRRDAADR